MKKYKLGDICEIVSGSTPKTNIAEFWDGDVKWITPAELDENTYVITDSVRKITNLAMQKTGLTAFPAGTVILSSRAPIGKVAIAGCEMCCNQGFKNFICSEIVNNKYLYWFLKHNNAYLNSLGRGATFKEISKSIVSSIEINLPSLEEQQIVVDNIEKISTIITLRKEEISRLDDLIKARFVELFGDQTTNPYGWQQASIGACCTLKSGTSLPADKENEGGAIPYVKVGDMNYPGNEQYITTSSRFVSEQTAGTGVFPVGTVVFPKRGGAIGTNKKRLTRIPICADLNVMGVTAGIRLTPQYLMAYFNNIDLGTLNNGSSVPQINNKDIAPLLICIPPMALQEQFAAFVAAIDKSKSHAPHLPIPPLKWYPLPKNEVPIMEEKIIAITNEMAEVLNIAQLKKLQEVLVKAFSTEEPERKPTNQEYLRLFLEAKSIEGCSPRTLQYYEVTVQHLFAAVNLPVRKMTTERMREYLSDYQQRRNCSKATIDNIRRNISSFFSWLEEEDHILKSPMRRIHKIKTKKTVKEVISDEDIEKLRDSCTTLRDLAMIDLLYSTGIRVGELVRLNIEDVNFESRECVVFGKGDKERRVYFDAKTKIHLKNYLESRRDTNRALFVSLLAPYNRLAISGVEIRLRKMGRMLNLKSIHPHKFRRTMATRAIDKGMPIEQVQKILGHSQIDTTMQYAIVNQNNVKMSHQKYIA